jgi:hypothetical protein
MHKIQIEPQLINTAEQAKEITSHILAEIRKRETKEIAIDFSNVRTDMKNADIFNLVLECIKHPELRSVVVYLIISSEKTKSAMFWISICQREGYNFNIIAK